MPAVDPEVPCQRRELVLEELWRPELSGRLWKVLALPAAELVVEHTGAPEPAQVGDRLDVVVGRARAAVADHDRSLRRGAVQRADDLVPGLVSVPAEARSVVAHALA